MKCPYCGKKGAKVDPSIIRKGALIHSAVDCTNPTCSACNAVAYGHHPQVLPEKHESYRKYLEAVSNE